MARTCFAMIRHLNICLWFTLCFVMSSQAFAAERIPANIEQSSMPVVDNFDWIVNPDGTLNIEDIQKEEIQKRFQPLNLDDIPQESGTVWLRFTIAERDPRIPPATLLLDMGEGIPATPTLYAPKYNMLSDTAQWQEYTPTQQSVFLMPEARSTPTTVYIRMDGMPGLWFAPMLRTPHNAATALERLAMPAVIVALGVVMLLCLLRGLTERGQWRVWSSLYTAAALFYAIWGIPPTAKGYVALNDMAAVIAPGVALILFSHVARHLMRSNMASRIIDLQYMLLSIPGIIVALVPLIPGYAWTVRYLALWPLLTIFFVPTTLGAWLSGLPGARRFLLGTLLPPIGAGIALAGLQEPHFLPLSILQTLPLWGVAIGSLIIAGTTTPQEYVRDIKKIQKKSQNTGAENTLDLNMEHTEHLDDNLDDPNLRVVHIDEAQSKDATKGENDQANAKLEESLRWPVDQLLRDVAALESCALPAAVREYVASVGTVARDISNTLSAPVEERNNAQAMIMEEDVFELQSLLRQAHDSVSPLADSKNIALSWFMPPHLSQNYKGDAVHLLFVLRLLLESSVRATNRGAVQLAVRRVPESVNPGHLLFTVTDTGTGRPPQERSVSALARAWELAASSHGFLGVESNAYGASISFTLNCEVATEAHKDAYRADESKYPRIIIVSDNDANRQLWAFFLENLPYNILEARNKKETLAQFAKGTAALVIFDTEEPTHILEQNINELREYESNNNLEAVPHLAIYDNDTSWGELENIGFQHSLHTPVTRTTLRNAIAEILQGKAPEEQSEAEDAQEKQDEIISTGMPVIQMPDLYTDSSEPEVAEVEEETSTIESTEDVVATEDTEDTVVIDDVEENTAIDETEEPEVSEASPEEITPLEEDVAEQIQDDLPEELPYNDEIKHSLEEELALNEQVAEPEDEQAIEQVTVEKTQNTDSEDELTEADKLEDEALKDEKSEEAHEQSMSDDIVEPDEDAQSNDEEAPSAVTEELAPKMGNSFVLPGIDPSKVKFNFVDEESEDEAEQMEQEPYLAPDRDRSNAAYLTSLIDTTKEEESTKDIAVTLKSTSNVEAKPTSSLGEDKPKPKITIGKANTTKVVPAVAEAPEQSKPKPKISIGKQTVSMPKPAPAPEPLAQQAVAEEAVQDTTNTTESVTKTTIKISDSKAKPKISIGQKQDEPTTPVAPVEEQEPEQSILVPEESVFEWQGEPMPTTEAEDGSNMQIDMQSTEEEASPELPYEPLTMHADIKTASPSFESSSSASRTEWVGDPMPILKEEAKAEEAKPTSTLVSMAQKLEAKLAQRKGKGGQKPNEPMQSVLPTVAPLSEPASNAASEPVTEQKSPVKSSIPSTPLQDLLAEIDENILEAKKHFAAGNTKGVAEATSNIAHNAESFGLRTLGRLARTVESAAKAGDMDALHDLFPELEINIERNRIALQI